MLVLQDAVNAELVRHLVARMWHGYGQPWWMPTHGSGGGGSAMCPAARMTSRPDAGPCLVRVVALARSAGAGFRLCHAVLRVDAVPTQKITKSLDLIAQGREGCPLLQTSGFVAEQLLFPVAKHRRILEVLGLDGALLVAADLGDLPVELAQLRSGAYALFQHRVTPFQRVETSAKLRQQLALPPASGTAGSRLLMDPPGRHQLDHLLTDPVRVNAQAVQHPYGGAVVLAEQAEQEVLGPDVA